MRPPIGTAMMAAMGRLPTAREQEQVAAGERPRPVPGSGPLGEALAMLWRRGLRPRPSRPDLPFPAGVGQEVLEQLAAQLGHYSFRLFFRGAIQRADGFLPSQTTRYLSAAQSAVHAETLVRLGLAERLTRGRYRLLRSARSFGGTLEWYVAHELARRLGLDAVAGLKLGARGVGGDLDVVAAAEGKLVYLELKSSPPRHLSDSEVAAFFGRLRALRPDVAVFVMDTALRLSDKVVPMLSAQMHTGAGVRQAPRRIVRETWALTPHLYAVNAKPDLVGNVCRAIAEGILALAPPVP